MNSPYSDNLVGQVLDGRYQLIERIGEGGMGVVYKAQQLASGQIAAVKVLNPHLATDPTWVQRFYNEAKATSQLQHPNTIRMHEFGQTPSGILYLAMEFLDGSGLRQVIATSAPMPPPRVLDILSQCCDSLAEAHAAEIIHRDIKPDNIFLLPQPRADFVKVLDFSVAKLLADHGFRTQAGMVFGTPEYMSPEQGRGRKLDARSDLYALGTIGFEMLTGRVPFADEHNPMAVLQAHMTAPIPALPSHVPPTVVELIKRSMAKEPGQRFSSAIEMKQHCDHLRAQLTGQAVPSAGAVVGHAKTMMASQGRSPAQAPPAQAPPAQALPGQPKTMIAVHNPLHNPQGGPPPAANPRGNAADHTTRSPQLQRGTPPAAARTMIATSAAELGLDPALLGQGGPPPARQGGPPPARQGGPPPARQGGPPPARQGGPPPARQGGPPARQGGPPPQATQPAQTPPGPLGSTDADARTMMAQSASELFGPGGLPALGSAPSMPPSMSSSLQAHAPAPSGSPNKIGSPNKTMMLNPSEGIISMHQPRHPPPMTSPVPPQGTSIGFWLICLVVGAATGVGAYLIVLGLS